MLELEKTRFNMFDVISLAKETILLKYGKEISIEIQSDRTEYPIVADEFHFSNVVYNILDNAIKYNDSTPKILIVITENQREVKLEFIDNGIGIETPELNAYFKCKKK